MEQVAHAAHGFAQSVLQPRVIGAFRNGLDAPDLFPLMGEAGLLGVTIPERPGSFLDFCETVGMRSITEFNYRYADASDARVFVGIQVRDSSETAKLVATLDRKKLKTLDLTDNEMAKLHLRHLVGGHAPGIKDEILFRFEIEKGARVVIVEDIVTTGLSIRETVETMRELGADVLAAAWEWTHEDTVVHALPLFHVFGMTVGMNWSISHGAAMVLMPNPRDFKLLVKSIAKHRVPNRYGC